MQTIWKYRHLLCFLTAMIFVQASGFKNWDIQRLTGPINDRWFRDYTPYFPGLDMIDGHEIFSPLYAHKKKIVLLGSSATDSIGCDGSWSNADPTREPSTNADYACSIAYQMNQQLKAAGFDDWRVFNLARNGTKLTPMLYAYSQLLNLKPDIIVFGDTFPYYMQENAGAEDLSPSQYAVMQAIFQRDPEAARLFDEFFQNLKGHGLKIKDLPAVQASVPEAFIPRAHTSIIQVLDLVLKEAKHLRIAKGPPLPPRIQPFQIKEPQDGYRNPDEGLRYLQGIALIAHLQKSHGGRTLMYFSPQGGLRHRPLYNEGLAKDFGGFAEKNGFDWLNLVPLELDPGRETYDTIHQTIFGNRKVASALLQNLQSKGILVQ